MKYRILAFIVTALVAGSYVVPAALSAADAPAKKPAGKERTKEGVKEGDKAGAKKEKPPEVVTSLLDEGGAFSATNAGEKYHTFTVAGNGKTRITWAATANAERNEHAASFLRVTLMYEVELDNAQRQKVWKLYGVITKEAKAGDGDQGTLNLAPNKYAVVASGSNIGYRLKVDQVGGK